MAMTAAEAGMGAAMAAMVVAPVKVEVWAAQVEEEVKAATEMGVAVRVGVGLVVWAKATGAV